MSFSVSGSGPTTDDARLNDYAGQYQKALDDRFKDDPIGVTPLMEMRNKEVMKKKGSNEYTVYTKPFVRIRTSTLDAQRQKVSGDNFLTTDDTKGGNIASIAVDLKFEDFKIQDTIDAGYEVDLTLGLDNAVNDPEIQARLSHDVYRNGRELAYDENIMKNAILSDRWLNNDTAAMVTKAAIAVTATTFDVTNAEAADFVAGRFLKIGDHKIASSTGGEEIPVDVAMVKTVGADDSGALGAGYALITIESDSANFPNGAHFDGAGEIFTNLVTALSAHTSGVKIQTDKPIYVTGATVDTKLIRPLKLLATNAYIDANKLVMYQPPEVTDLMTSQTSPFTTNDFLGKEVLKTGKIGDVRGMSVSDSANAIKRVMPSGQTTYYVWAFERNQCYFWVKLKESKSIFEKIQQRAGLLYKDTYFEVHGSHTPRSGKIRSILVPIILEEEEVA